MKNAKKMKVLEHAFAGCAGAYYNINLTKDLVPGTMYQVIDDKEYSLNEQMGLPENARFTDVVAYWGERLSEEEKTAYFEFLSIPNLLKCFHEGREHVWHQYWTKSAIFEPMLAQQHIVMYEDDETEDILAISYVLDLTQKFREESYKRELEEKQAKLEKALEEANQARQYRELQAALAAVDDVLRNITMFDAVTSEEEMSQIMPNLLASLGRYSMSDRAYAFTWASEEEQILRMTHEWCAEGVAPTIDEMQNLKMHDMPNWAPRLRRGEPIVSMDWEADKTLTPEEYQVFDGQEIHSLIVIPVFASRKLNGYIGFDNPEKNMTELSVRILSSVGAYIGGLKENLSMMAEQEKQKKQLEDALASATLNSEIIDSISKIYWMIYRMDLTTGTYEEISAGQDMHQLTGKRGSTAEAFRDAKENIVAKEHQEMMGKFLDTSTLPERLKDTESVAVEYHAASGSWHLARFIVKKRDKNGRVTNVLYVVRKIDRQKQLEIEYRNKLLKTAEEARRANIAKTDFLRRMSHDIRTPINGILGMVNIAEHYPEDSRKQAECREKVKEAAGFLLDLVNNILDMNKLESGTISLDHASFDLLDVLKEANHITKMNGELKGLSISLDHSKVQHQHLLGSPLHLKQILQNIAGNAVKYNRENGAIYLSTEELSCEDGRARYRFICSDTGRGMSESFLQHAFEPFAQEDVSARTSYMGTGLGLSIVKQLVELMDGTIEVSSELGKGTCFAVELPFEIDMAYEETQNADSFVSEGTLEGVRVLVAEDNEINMEIARFILEKAGIQVTPARNGKEAVDIFAASVSGEFDLILMDVMMPEMDGLTAARTIRAMERQDARNIPILAMTANAFKEDIEQSREAGMNAHISKPLDEVKMLRAIKKCAMQRK